jgi:GMP reductase
MKIFDYDAMNLIPKYCIVNSRSECDTSIQFGKYIFKMPIIPANMECVMNDTLAIKLAKHNYFYIMHRFNVNIKEFCETMINNKCYISISLGVNQDAYRDVDMLKLYNIEPDYITLDIAHGHCIKMKSMIEYIRFQFPNTFIIAGNVSTPEAVIDLEAWGAHAIKVGIGPGSACTTYNATGFGSRGAQAFIVEQCAKVRSKAHIIADGGISHPSDITKSIVLGASMVMIGGMFSGLTDSPGNTVQGIDGKLYKEFWGSASSYQSNKKNRIEGTKKLIPMKQHDILSELKYLEECVQSSISYGGGKDILCLRSVEYFLKNS